MADASNPRKRPAGQLLPSSGYRHRARVEGPPTAVCAGPEVPAAARRQLPLFSPSLDTIRQHGMPFVDKTAAVAELLNFSHPLRVFFARPRKFGKSLTLEMAAHMLAAGSLPPGVDPWPGYKPVDIEKMFGGLAVYDELTAPLAEPYDQLNVAHFVITLELGAVSIGTELKQEIIDSLARNAGEHFGEAAKAEIRSYTLIASALKTLIDKVPDSVPIAVLIDEYDAAIMCDVGRQRWEAAEAGVDALRDLLMTFKSGHYSGRVRRCVVTGVARFARVSLFSGANNYADLTLNELMSRVLGFTEAEIRHIFEPELVAMGEALLPAEQRGDASAIDAAIGQLKAWYNGYSFDGKHTCYAPFHVMRALQAGVCDPEDSLESAANVSGHVLNLTQAAFVRKLVHELDEANSVELQQAKKLDIADLQVGDPQVRLIPLLLQVGLLTLVPAPTDGEEAATGATSDKVLCAPPNALARKQLSQLMFGMGGRQRAAAAQLSDAICARDNKAFGELLRQHMFELPKLTTKPGVELRASEALHHAFWLALLKVSVSPDIAKVISEEHGAVGRADVVLHFTQVREVWVLEFGVTDKVGVQAEVNKKLQQARAYAQAYTATNTVHYAAVVVSNRRGASASRDSAAAMNACVVKWGESVGPTAASGGGSASGR